MRSSVRVLLVVALLLFSGCSESKSPQGKVLAQSDTSLAVARSGRLVDRYAGLEDIWMFTHPTHLRWWILPNMEKSPNAERPITGVFCIFVNTASGSDSVQYLNEVRTRCEKLGLKFAYGIRHTHQSYADIKLPFDPAWQQRSVDELLAAGDDYLALDMEPYYSGARRYHNSSEYEQLEKATYPWQAIGRRDLFIYPAGPPYMHGLALTRQAMLGCVRVHGLDATTYKASTIKNLEDYLALRNSFFETEGVDFMPGMYLYNLTDDRVMRAAAKYGACWVFARTSPNHPDDLPHFGLSTWRPVPLKE